MRDLPIPASALSDPEAFEYLRLWSTERGDDLSLLATFGNAEIWGIALADVGRRIARSLAGIDGSSPDDQLSAIENAFNVELKAQLPRV